MIIVSLVVLVLSPGSIMRYVYFSISCQELFVHCYRFFLCDGLTGLDDGLERTVIVKKFPILVSHRPDQHFSFVCEWGKGFFNFSPPTHKRKKVSLVYVRLCPSLATLMELTSWRKATVCCWYISGHQSKGESSS